MAYCQMCADKEVEIEALRARIAVLEKAVDFYSAEGNWSDDQLDIGVGNTSVPWTAPVWSDRGRIAQAALKEGK